MIDQATNLRNRLHAADRPYPAGRHSLATPCCLAVTSARTGCGTTTICHFLQGALRERGVLSQVLADPGVGEGRANVEARAPWSLIDRGVCMSRETMFVPQNESCNLCVLVLTPEVATIAAAYAWLKKIHDCGTEFRGACVVNQVSDETYASELVARLNGSLQKNVGRRVECWGMIPLGLHALRPETVETIVGHLLGEEFGSRIPHGCDDIGRDRCVTDWQTLRDAKTFS